MRIPGALVWTCKYSSMNFHRQWLRGLPSAAAADAEGAGQIQKMMRLLLNISGAFDGASKGLRLVLQSP